MDLNFEDFVYNPENSYYNDKCKSAVSENITDMTIKERMDTLKELHNNGIYTVLFMSPVFPYITEWKEIIDQTKDYVDEYWFENLNLRGNYKKEILDYIRTNYSDLYSDYIDIYLKKNNKYWKDLAEEINNYCNLNNINYTNYFYHKELVEKKKEGN